MKKKFKLDLKKSNKKALCLGIAVTDTYAKSIDKIPKWDTLGTCLLYTSDAADE